MNIVVSEKRKNKRKIKKMKIQKKSIIYKWIVKNNKYLMKLIKNHFNELNLMMKLIIIFLRH